MTELTGHLRAQAERGEPRGTSPHGVLVDGRLRLDPVYFRKACLVSVRSEEDCGGLDPGEAGIPRPWRPRLADIRPLLKKRESWLGWPLTPMVREGNLTLQPVDEAGLETRARADLRMDREGSEEGFRVVGVLNHSLPRAVERLRAPGDIAEGDWLKPAELFTELTAAEARWVKNIPSAVNLTAIDPAIPPFPVVKSERYVKAAEAVFKGLLRPECTAVQLKGDAGTGKSRLIRSLAEDAVGWRVPSRLQGHLVVGLNIELFMNSYLSFEETEKSQLRTEMAGRRVIWVIDEASRLVQRGDASSLDNLLLFIDAGARVILLSDQAHLLEKREAFKRRLSPVYLPPADRAEVDAIVASRARSLEKATGLAVRPDAVKAAAELSGGSGFAQPHAALTLLGNTVTSCELAGAPEVSAAHVECELQAMAGQGSLAPRMPATVEEWLERLRQAGFCGHGDAAKAFVRALLRALRRRHRPERPAGPVWSGVIAGRPGGGKSFLAALAGRLIAGSERKVMQVDCKFYQRRHAVQSLRGSPMSYIGHEEGGILQNFIRRTPDGVLIFDNPELGHPNLLQVIDGILEGEFTAGDGQQLSTRGLVVLLTTRADARSGPAPIGLIRPGGPGARAPAELYAALSAGVMSRIGLHNVFQLGVLEPPALRRVLRLQLDRYAGEEGVGLQVDEPVFDEVLAGVDVAAEGARGVIAAFRARIEPVLDDHLEQEQSRGAGGLCVFVNDRGEIACLPAGPAAAPPPEAPEGGGHGG